MADDALELIRLRNNFYRDNYRKTMVALLIAVMTVFILLITLVYSIDHRPKPVYFATTASGAILPLKPLNEPAMNSAAMLNWFNNTMTSALTFDFQNYRMTLSAVTPNFTPEGWINFMRVFQSSILKDAINQKQVVSAVAAGAPVITNQGVSNGIWTWLVEEPVLLTFQGPNGNGGSSNYNVSYLIKATVDNVSTLDNPLGVGISEVVMTQTS